MLIPGPGGFSPELVIARWSDGQVATRWCGRWRPGRKTWLDPTDRRIAMMCGPDQEFKAWVQLGDLSVRAYGEPRGQMRLKTLLQAALPDCHLRNEVEEEFSTLACSAEPVDVVDDVRTYLLLSEIHPVLLPEPIFREWLTSTFPGHPALGSLEEHERWSGEYLAGELRET